MTGNSDSSGANGELSERNDWRGIGEIIALTTDQLVNPVKGMHLAILDRWLGLAGPSFDPVRRAVGRLTASVYETVRLGGAAIGSTISIASEVANDHETSRPFLDRSKGAYVQSILNGVWGDRLESEGSALRIELGLRDGDGNPVPTNRTSLNRAFPNPTTRLVVMLHGFGETEECWRSDRGSSLTEGLRDDGFSVLSVRYNTGRPVKDNASALSDLLDALRLEWPVRVEEVVLIGHSMGGLVAQTAAITARTSGHGWADLTTHLVAIGTPHLGTPIEKALEVAGKGLGFFRETRPLAAFLESRSAGIKDLRHGADERPEGVHYHAIAGAVTAEGHPLGALVGDLVVRVSSALGSSRADPAHPSSALVVGGTNHADLLHEPKVISHIRAQLGQALKTANAPTSGVEPG